MEHRDTQESPSSTQAACFTQSFTDSSTRTIDVEGNLRDSASQTDAEHNQNQNNNGEQGHNGLQFGPRVRGRSQRPATDAVSTMSAPAPDWRSSDVTERRRSPLSPARSPLSPGRSPLSLGRSPGRSDGNLNGLADLAAFRDASGNETRDGSTHRAEYLSLPSATWTPPSLRHFGFPTEFKGFLEVNVIGLLSPWMEKVWKVLKEDFQKFPDNWKNIPSGRRAAYMATAFVSCYYFVISLYAIPLLAVGFLTPAYICRKYLERDEIEKEGEDSVNNNNNDDDDVDNLIVSVKEMSNWMKFWVSFCGWLLSCSLAPGFLAAILPLKILTLLFVVSSLVTPWKSNPAPFVFDRLLLPLLRSIDGYIAASKEKIINVVSNVERHTF